MSTETFYPYATAPEGLLPTLSMADPDVRRRSDGAWDASNPMLEEVRTNVTLEVADDLLESVLPEGEQSKPPVQVVFTALSLESRRRNIWRFEWKEAISAAVELVLPRSNWVGEVTMQAVLVRTKAAAQPEDGFAFAKMSRLAWSTNERIIFDDAGQVPPGARLDIQWTKFGEGNDWLQRCQKQLFALEYSDVPRLLLNEDVNAAKLILSTVGTRGGRARIRDATFMQIAHQTWSSLLMTSLAELATAAAAETEADNETLLAEIAIWRAGILRDWARWLFPEAGDQDGAIATLVEQVRTPAMEELTLRRVPYAISQRLETWKGFIGLSKEFGVADPEELTTSAD